MADQKKDASLDDDKSINDLLKEYADDVKDKDLDDFLKSASDDDAFEGEDDSAVDDDDDKAEIVSAPKKSGGFLTMLLTVVAFGAAGAGAYMYLNRDSGMTSIMGGFAGGAQNSAEMGADMPPPAPESSPTLPQPQEANAATEAPVQPLPIVNDTASNDAPPPPAPPGADYLTMPTSDPLTPAEAAAQAAGRPAAPVAPVETKTPVAAAKAAPDVVTAASPATPVPTEDKSLPAPPAASAAVDDWVSGTTGDKLPEQNVSEIKAKPPVNTSAKTKKVTKVTNDALAAATPAPKADTAPAPTAEKKRAAAPARSDDGLDGALQPPYVAIQAQKGGAYAPASSGKMAPVVEGRASAVSSGARNVNEADVSKATGDYAAMIAKGGGVIELNSSQTAAAPAGVPAPVGMLPKATAAQPQMQIIPLAINGGKSLPPGSASRVYAELPDGGATASTPAAQPQVPAVPVQQVDSAPVWNDAPAAASSKASAMIQGATKAAAPAIAAPAASVNTQDAKSILASALAADKAGNTADALKLYQRALEADAVYGDGKSIDRAMVYDRIGAIHAGGR